MPQTDEAIDHARAADVPILVAVNKIDKEGADPTRVRTEMTQLNLQPSEWGGDTEFVDVSAKTQQGLEDLLDTILVVAELEELEANPDAEASGVVIESKLDPGRGPVVTVLIQRGTLRVGDALVGRRRTGARSARWIDYNGERVDEAVPGDPVEVLGFDGVPDAGEFVARRRQRPHARASMADERAPRAQTEALARRSGRKVSFEDVFKRHRRRASSRSSTSSSRRDVSGSVEALRGRDRQAAPGRGPRQRHPHRRRRHHRVRRHARRRVRARSSSASTCARWATPGAAAEREGVEIRPYSVIYRALDDLRDAMTGMLEPEEVEETVGTVEVRQTFRASRIGTIAGCYVTDGHVTRGAKVRIVRDGTVIYDTTIASLQRFNDDVREVAAGLRVRHRPGQLPGRQGGRRVRGLTRRGRSSGRFRRSAGFVFAAGACGAARPGHRGRMACPPREVERRSSRVRTG